MSLSNGDHIDSIRPPFQTGVKTTVLLSNCMDKFVDSLLQDMVFKLSVTP